MDGPAVLLAGSFGDPRPRGTVCLERCSPEASASRRGWPCPTAFLQPGNRGGGSRVLPAESSCWFPRRGRHCVFPLGRFGQRPASLFALFGVPQRGRGTF